MNAQISPTDLTLVIDDGKDAAAVYKGEERILVGHVDDVQERLLDLLGVAQYGGSLVVDPAARGWDGVAKTLSDVPTSSGRD